MNIHPLFVHFPVALLSIYAILECIRSRKLLAQESWFHLKSFLVIVGTIFSYLALYTGSLAEDLRHQGMARGVYNPIFHLIDVHSNWAVVTSIVFSLISVLYIIEFVHRLNTLPQRFANSQAWQITLKINKFLLSAPIIIPLAVIGLIAITITGALGGAVEYGSNSDPIVHLIYTYFS